MDWRHPIKELLAGCREKNYRDLSSDNVPITYTKPKRPLFPMIQFRLPQAAVCHSDSCCHRGYGLLEKEWLKIFETTYSGYLVQDSTSSWAPEDNAIGKYAIAVYNTPCTATYLR
jgi:hypothetical protein